MYWFLQVNFFSFRLFSRGGIREKEKLLDGSGEFFFYPFPVSLDPNHLLLFINVELPRRHGHDSIGWYMRQPGADLYRCIFGAWHGEWEREGEFISREDEVYGGKFVIGGAHLISLEALFPVCYNFGV